MAYKSVNPFNGAVLRSFDNLSDAQIEAALERAQSTYEIHWRVAPVKHRASILHAAAGIMRKRIDELAKLATLEMGKRIAEAKLEVVLSADILDYYAQNGEAFLAAKQLQVSEGEAEIVNDALGIILCVEPWNFPYYQLVRVVGPSLLLGNVMLVKHASNVPQCAEAFEKVLKDAGAMEGVYTNLFATKDQVTRLIADERVKGVALTGSEAAGASVASMAGKNLKKSTMELGGSDPFIVLEDADLDRAISWGLWGRLNNTGQSCGAAKRFIVVEKVADEFLRRLKASFELLRPGDPLDPTTTLAPLSSGNALAEILGQVNTAVSSGATIVLGGKRMDRPGAFIEASILTNVDRDNPAYFQEFFGPVALFFRVKDEEAAIVLANDSKFGLGGSVFSEDIARAKKVARRLETGMVFINQATSTAPELPFGGVKNSGYGRELSDLGLQEFANKKLIRVTKSLPGAHFPVAS